MVKEAFTDKKIFRIQLFAVGAGVLLLLAKFAAYFLTHSNAILTDALESIINVIAGTFALYSLYISSKPKDNDHPYGHGKVEFISAGFEGILIAIAGAVNYWFNGDWHFGYCKFCHWYLFKAHR